MDGMVHLPLIFDGQESPASEVWVGRDLLTSDTGPIQRPVKDWLAGRLLFIVSSPTVMGWHGGKLEALRRCADRTVFLSVPDGERAKSIDHAHELWQAMLEAGGKRDSRLVTFGGGSVGDLGGFVAACFVRGIEYAQIPTTLLAQVDASLGGKTAIDMPQGKNLVGAFLQPKFVLSDTRVLETLPPPELRAGLVEAVKKAALLDDGALFVEMEERLDDLLAGDPETVARVVAGAARLKLDVVARDVRESGLRKVLNFGHTLAHALEQQLGYRGLRHGEAVAYGMLFALRLASRRGGVADDMVIRLPQMLRRFELPDLPTEAMTLEGLMAAMGRDKKASRAGLTWVLPAGLGKHRFDSDLKTTWVASELESFLDDPWDGLG